MPDDRLARTRDVYDWKTIRVRIANIEVPEGYGLPEDQIEVRDGVVVRDGKLVKRTR